MPRTEVMTGSVTLAGKVEMSSVKYGKILGAITNQMPILQRNRPENMLKRKSKVMANSNKIEKRNSGKNRFGEKNI